MKILPELHEEVLSRVLKGETLDQVRAWLKRAHKIEVSKVAVGKLVRKHRKSRAEVSHAATVEHISKRIPKDLAESDEMWDANVRLLKLAQAEAETSLTSANVAKVVQLSEQVRRVEADRRKALGLDQPDTSVAEFDGIGELLGLNFKPSA